MNKRVQQSCGQRVFTVLNTLFMILFMAIILYPVLNILAVSLSSDTPVLTGKVTIYPVGIDLAAYKIAFSNKLLLSSYMNTIFVAVVGSLLSVIMTSFAAYPLAYVDFYGKKLISFLIMFTMWFSAGMIPSFMVIRSLGLFNSLFSLILGGLVSAYNTIILRNYYNTIPSALVESAYLDGANDFQVLFHIVTPMAKPALAIIVLWGVVGFWNDFFGPLLYLHDSNKYTLQLVLRDIVMEASGTELYGMSNATVDGASHSSISEQTRNAVVFLSMVPMLIIYPFLQKYFVTGMMIGAVKG
ncbi:MAG: carbohydrate ABC transporter permease [Christensenellales bacterium]|nr:carbohydrate ABC transporter permease [Christensenellales bacterium]